MPPAIEIISCNVFKDALSHLTDRFSGRPLRVHYLPANLHLNPMALKKRLLVAIQEAKQADHRPACLYGICFPGIDKCLGVEGVDRIRCDHCYETFLGRRRYRRLIDACPGSFFVEKELLLDFDDLCRGPLELDDPEIREIYFSHYSQVVYIRQPRDPDLMAQARFVADLLGLRLTIVDAEYTELIHFLDQLG
jgi:hypothetical protein